MIDIDKLCKETIEALTDDELNEAVFSIENREPSDHLAKLLNQCLDEIDYRYHECNDGQPDWQQEWEDFGEVYDDDREYL